MKNAPPVSALELNRDFYGNLKAGQLDYWRKMPAARERVKTFLRLLKDIDRASVVDLGCGGGELLNEIHRVFPALSLSGIDLSEAQITLNRKMNPNIEWLSCNLDGGNPLPTSIEKKFDVILASEIIEHLETPELFLRQARKLARGPETLLILSTQSGPVHQTERLVGHQRHFTVQEMRSLMKRTGWESIRVWNEGFPFHNFSKWLANLNPDFSMNQFGYKRYGVLQNTACRVLGWAYALNVFSCGYQLYAIGRAAQENQ